MKIDWTHWLVGLLSAIGGAAIEYVTKSLSVG